MKARIFLWLFAVLIISLCGVRPASALFIDFESGTDLEPIETIDGLIFSAPNGGKLYYADIRTGGWQFNNGDSSLTPDTWEHFIHGNIAAGGLDDNVGIIDFTEPVSYFGVYYCSLENFVLKAYDATNLAIETKTGPKNSRSAGGTAMSQLWVQYDSGIKRVEFWADLGDYPEAGYWVVDDIEVRLAGEPVIPEWPSTMLAALPLAGLLFRRRT